MPGDIRFEHQPFAVPPPDGEWVKIGPKTREWREPNKVADLCYEYFTEDLQRIDSLPAQRFDHIVPLASGGLNDITNIQLLCDPCNATKSAKPIAPSDTYRRWYELGR